jgi:lipid-binding SYLF domain-containing protein
MSFRNLVVLLVCMTFGAAAHAAATKAECEAAVGKFKELGDVGQKMSEAYGWAVLPTIGKGGVGIGGAGGTGCVFAQGVHTGNVKMGQVTIGFQLGGQAYSQMVLFQNEDTWREFTSGNFEFGADATAVALTYGAAAGADTQGASASAGDTKAVGSWKRGMAIYTLAKGGLMYEASIGGQKYSYESVK